MSGVEVLANAIDTVLRERYLATSTGWTRALLVGGLGILASVIFILLNIRARISSIVYVTLIGGFFWATTWFFTQRGIVLDLVAAEAALTLPFLGGIAYHRFLTAMEKARITRTFGLYVSPQVVERLIRNPDLVKLGGEKKEMTVLFADAREFTSMAEKLDPTDVVRILNQFHTAVTEVIFKNEGVLDKYMGDAVMSFYGAPIEMEDHAARACITALEMEEALLKLHTRWQEEGLPVIDMGVGLNTGAMVVGNMGSSMRFDYTVMGDSVNLGSRLEGLNKVYGTRIIVSEFTRQLAGDGFTFRDLDLVRVKGRSEPVRIYELISTDGQGRPEYLDLYNQAIGLYRLRQWEKAGGLFQQVLAAAPGDGPSILYVERCMEMSRSYPPEDWDGVYEMKVK
jgi:adenylate cyclase